MLEAKTINQEQLFESVPKDNEKRKRNNSSFSPVYEHPNGTLFEGDAVECLKSLESGSVDLIFADSLFFYQDPSKGTQ